MCAQQCCRLALITAAQPRGLANHALSYCRYLMWSGTVQRSCITCIIVHYPIMASRDTRKNDILPLEWRYWGVKQAYSRLSTTHDHITDCNLDSVVYAGVCVVI